MMARVLSLVLSAQSVAAASAGTFQQQCSTLLNHTSIVGANFSTSEFVAAGSTLVFPGADPTCGRPSQNVSVNLCRISAHVATSNRSAIKFELWLPETWSGRFLSTGNGGLGGCIQFEDIEF